MAPVLLIAHPALAFERPTPPQVLLGDLYADVEPERIFPDSKEVADATPKRPAPRSLSCWLISAIDCINRGLWVYGKNRQ
jgi:hypothetical protein